MKQTSSRPIELLAPARTPEIAIDAIKHGADAVYMGASSFGARVAAANSLDDISRAVNYAHQFGCRVYCTVNTIVYDDELKDVERLINELYRREVDALIVQDLGILRMDIPPIALHASTQCDTRDAEKAKFLESVGFSQIVLARELTLHEIRNIGNSVSVPLEAFVHGALCVSYSGDCQASFSVNGRSANRGECAQMCRLPYQLLDDKGNTIQVARGRHLLSLKDMNRIEMVAEMIEAGVSSFKIEGRLKDKHYVKNVVAAYRKAIDTAIAANPDRYHRASLGDSELTFSPALPNSFNRGYTDYFLRSRKQCGSIASIESPKSTGTVVGCVKRTMGNAIRASLSATLHNGDGMGFYDENGEFNGFRLNKVEGELLYPANRVNIKNNTTLFRNSDKLWEDMLDGDTADRRISVTLTLRKAGQSAIALDASVDGTGISVSTSIDIQPAKASTDQITSRCDALSKLGTTNYRLVILDDTLGNIFVPKSQLTALRRKTVESLDRAIALNHRFGYRKAEDTKAPLPGNADTSYHDNISNHLARQFYESHGAKTIETALETSTKIDKDSLKVMTTRYCLRRELGCCLKGANADLLPRVLFIKNGNIKFRLKFDCKNCEMQVLTTLR